MLIVINEEQLKDIITSYLHETMQGMSDWRYDVELKAGRGDNGHRAEIIMTPPSRDATSSDQEEAAPADDEPAITNIFGGSDESEDS